MKRKGILTLIMALACGLCITGLYWLGVLEGLELKSLDVRFRQFARPERASDDVVLAAIDEKSLQAFKRNNIVWKWPRDIYALLVRYLNRGGARVVAFDILFADADIDRLSTDAEQTDGAFAQAMAEAGNVLLGVHLRNDEDLLSGDNPLVRTNDLAFVPDTAALPARVYSTAVLPIPLFQQSASGLGTVNYQEDSDGVCRRLPLFFSFQNSIFPHLGLLAYLRARGIDRVEVPERAGLRLGDNPVPLDRDGNFLISWYGRGGPRGAFQYYSISALIGSALAEMRGREPAVPSSHFKDKIVIVGSNAPALFDFRNTPFTAYEPYPAMEIYATLISNLLQRDYLTRVHPGVVVAAIFVFVFVVCFAFMLVRRVPVVVAIAAACVLLWVAAAFVSFAWYHLWVDLVAPVASAVLAFSVAAVVSYQTEGRARRYLRSVFNRYLSPVVISEVIEKSDRVQLGGKEIVGTVYFSDIKDFTSISEQMAPGDLVTLLNEYFSVATDIILKHEGLLDKYIGDAIMAIFGAPISNDSHAVQACTAALQIHNTLQNNWYPEEDGRPRLETRIGINTGNMVVGNIGSQLRLDYTAIGDTVNLASRLEGVNKIFKTNIIISETTYALVKDHFVTRQLDLLRVKGKRESVGVYELVGFRDERESPLQEKVERFEAAARAYRARAFDKAVDSLEALLQDFPDDGPARLYLDRSRMYLKTPPPPEWDGVFTLDTK